MILIDYCQPRSLPEPIVFSILLQLYHLVSIDLITISHFMETVTDFIFLGSKITAYGDCIHEIKRHLLLGNPLQCSCLENPRDGGAWWAAIYGVTQSRARLKRLSSSSSVSCSVMSDSLLTHELYPTRLLCPWDFPGKNTGVGCHALLQGICQTQGLNQGLLHGRQILYHLSH